MGCWTGYLLRDDDGSCRFAGIKWGDWQIVDDSTRASVIASIRGEGVSVAETKAGQFDIGYCQGVAIDLPAKVFRFFPCHRPHLHKGSLDRQLRAAPVWAGWDVGLAWGGREELAELVPEARHVVAPYDLAFRPLGELLVGDRDEWFASWDPDRFELEVRMDIGSADWFEQGCDLVSVITTDLKVLDYRLGGVTHDSSDTLLPWLAHGSAFVDTLGELAPYPVPAESVTDAGLVIDLDERVLSYWTADFVPTRLLERVHAAWPGWQLRRLWHGLAEHLAATGRGGLGDPRPLRAPLLRVSEDR